MYLLIRPRPRECLMHWVPQRSPTTTWASGCSIKVPAWSHPVHWLADILSHSFGLGHGFVSRRISL